MSFHCKCRIKDFVNLIKAQIHKVKLGINTCHDARSYKVVCKYTSPSLTFAQIITMQSINIHLQKRVHQLRCSPCILQQQREKREGGRAQNFLSAEAVAAYTKSQPVRYIARIAANVIIFIMLTSRERGFRSLAGFSR